MTYDSPSNNFKRIANLWRIHLHNRYGEKYNHALPILDAADVAMMMTLMKLARLEYDPTSLDQWVDIAGYAACGANIMVRR